MQQSLIRLALLWLLGSREAGAQQRWVPLGVSQGGDTSYLDAATLIGVKPSVWRAWTRMSGPSGSTSSRSEFDCTNREYRDLSIVSFDANGQPKDTFVPRDTSWREPYPQSMIEGTLRHVCADGPGIVLADTASLALSTGTWRVLLMNETDTVWYHSGTVKLLRAGLYRLWIRRSSSATLRWYGDMDCKLRRWREIMTYDEADGYAVRAAAVVYQTYDFIGQRACITPDS